MHANRKWGLFHLKIPWRYQICISKCLYYYKDELSKIGAKKPSKNENKKTTSGWRASLKNVFAPEGGRGGCTPLQEANRDVSLDGVAFHDWSDYNGVAFSIWDLLECGRKFSDFGGK